jgi:TolB-like protein/DNA-binding winged helix-turn-helix (wHTH) protein/Tfp pilus assembly protein PilF
MAVSELRPARRFTPFEVDFRAHELRKHGVKLKLSGQPFEILALLLNRPGEVITREELRANLWPADTFVDFDHGLNAAVNKLREVLGDSAEKPRFVETLPRRGYRFIAPVEEHVSPRVAAASQPQAVAPSAASAPASRLRAAVVLLLLLFAVTAAALLGWRRFHHPAAQLAGNIKLAVLPFENLTSKPENEYLADGMTDELITDLVRVGGPQVISRTSVMRYKGVRKSLPEIARELNVDAVIEGTLQTSNGRIHVSVQLVQARPEKHLWAESYDRPAADTVVLQSELAREIAGAVHINLSPEQQARLERNVSPEAYQLYLKGRYFWNKRTGEGFKTAIQYFNQAIAKQPNYAAAYAGLADSYLLLGGYFFVSQNESIPKARAAAQKALQLDGSLADAHATLGLIAMNYDWNWAEAERQYRQAIALNPNYATAHHWYAEYLTLVGRFDEGLAEIRVAETLDPLSVIVSTDHCKYLLLARRYDSAIKQCQATIEMDPHFVRVYIWLADAEIRKGMFAESIATLERARAMDDWLDSSAVLVYAYAVAGRRSEAKREFERLKRSSKQRHVDPAMFVPAYIGLGDKQQAFAWMEREYTEHSAGLTGMKVHPVFDPLRSDPRFADLMRRVGLPP